MLLVDTGPLVAYLNRRDPDHARCAGLLDGRTDELLVTPYVLTEACYLIAKSVAERLKLHEVATLDRRHFHAVRPAHVPAFDLLP